MQTYLIMLVYVFAPALAANAQTAAPSLFDLKFTKDYFPGTRDVNGQWSGGTEDS